MIFETSILVRLIETLQPFFNDTSVSGRCGTNVLQKTGCLLDLHDAVQQSGSGVAGQTLRSAWIRPGSRHHDSVGKRTVWI